MTEETKIYFELLPIVEKLYNELFEKPKTHKEWVEGFNIRGKIVDVLKQINYE